MPVRPLPKIPLTPPKSPSPDREQQRQSSPRSPYGAQRPQSLDWNVPSPSSSRAINRKNLSSRSKHHSQSEGPAPKPFFGTDRYEGGSSDSPGLPGQSPPRCLNPMVRRTKSTTYIFVPSTSGESSMNLIPHNPDVSAAPAASAYHVAVQMNCFIPGVFQSTVYRGHDRSGDIVGDFELGAPDRHGVIGIRGEEFELDSLLRVKEDMSSTGPRFEWARNNLRWNCDQTPSVCTVRHPNGSSITVAKFTTSRRPRKPGEMTPPLAQLELFSPGTNLLDDIILSALIVEQIRLSRPSPRNLTKI